MFQIEIHIRCILPVRLGVHLAKELDQEIVDDGFVWDGGDHSVHPRRAVLREGHVSLEKKG